MKQIVIDIISGIEKNENLRKIADFISIQTSDGEIVILPNHYEAIYNINGEIKIFFEKKLILNGKISSGIADFSNNKLNIFADKIEILKMSK